jgi:AcrR family transcriptional regulator
MSVRNTRSLIIEAALRMVSRQGIEGLTLGALAKDVGMSKSGLFAHFRAKDHLQLSVLKTATERFVGTVLKPAFREPRGEPRIRALFELWIAHLNDAASLPGGSVLIAASTELDDRPGPLRDFVKDAQQSLMANVARAAKIAVEEGHFRQDLDVELFAWSLYSFVLGYHHFKRMLEDPKADEHVRQSFLALLSVARAQGKPAGQGRDR